MSEFRVDYFSFTVFMGNQGEYENFDQFIRMWLGQFGNIDWKGYGHRGFQRWGTMLAGVNVYRSPVNEHKHGEYFHIEIKGEACALLSSTWFAELWHYWQDFEKPFKVTRLDLAFDYAPFEPIQVWEALEADLVNTPASRSSFQLIMQPHGVKDDGSKGTSTVYIGSANSDRRLRAYDKRGFTRVELQLRKKWAMVSFAHLMKDGGYNEPQRAMELIRQYADMDTEWWIEFVANVEKAQVSAYTARKVTVDKMREWVENQAAPTIVFLMQYRGGADTIHAIMEAGKGRLSNQHKAMLKMAGKDLPIQ